jgi:hypothetical protein
MRRFLPELSTYFHNRKSTTRYDCCPTKTVTMLLKDIANAIAANHPEVYLIVLLIDERRSYRYATQCSR